MEPATEKVARAIASKLRDIDKRTPAAQMAAYFAVGGELQMMVMDQGTFGATAIQDTVERVPQLRDESRAYEVMNLAAEGTAFRKLVREQAAIPMSNGQPLTLGHWIWVMRRNPADNPMEQESWLLDELAWLRKESPSAAVIEHIEEVMAEGYERERERSEEMVRKAIGLLESL